MLAQQSRPTLYGAGAPSGTPLFNGIEYVDTVTGTRWLGRNVLNFNNDTFITLPSTITASRVTMRVWHNDPAPAALRPLLTNAAYTSRVIRSQTTGFINSTNTSNLTQINGTSVSNNSTDTPANQWSTVVVGFATPVLPTDIIGRRAGLQGFIGRIADVTFEANGVKTNSYSINDGSTTIIDSVSGQNATLTLGSGSWELVWMPMDQNLIVGNGPPTGTPSVAGLDYLDLTNNVRYRSRNVFNAVLTSNIAFPTVPDARRITFRFWHNESSPAALRQYHNSTGGQANRAWLTRAVTTGVINAVGLTPSQIALDGGVIANNSTNPSANEWHKIVVDYPSDAILDRVFNANYVGKIADFQIENASGLVRSYAIDDNSNTLVNGVGGNNATLTPAGGAWSLDWVPQN